MKKLNFFIATFLLSALSVLGQNQPRIVVLYPNDIKASQEILTELEAYEQKMEVTEELRAKFVNSDLPEHWQINRSHLLEFLKEQDFYGLLTKATSDQLTYYFNDREEAVINFPVKDISHASKENYKQLATKYEVAWVVNFTTMELSNEYGTTMIKTYVQLYNSISNVVWLSKEYIGKAGEDCETNEWECALAKVVEEASYDLYNMLDKKRDYWSAYLYESTH